MDDKRHDISQIRKYLNGELDARAMNQLEREAQDDPFLMDAMDGYEQATGLQQRQLNDLDAMLQKRIGESKVRRIIPWKYYAAAASVLLFFTLGYWFWPGRQQASQSKQMAEVVTAPADHATASPDTVVKTDKEAMLAANVPAANKPRPQFKPRATVPVADKAIRTNEHVGKGDTKAIDENYAFAAKAPAKNASLDELLKKMPGISVDSSGNITAQERSITKIKLNGKDYTGGDVQQVVKNLPADIIEKIQVIDDYGDQAAKTGIKKNEYAKVLSIGTKKAFADSNQTALKEVSIAGLAKLSQKDIEKKATAPQTLKSKVEGAQVTTPKKISGTILSDLGLPLPGATVYVDGTKKATQTDAQGHFSIPAEGQATLNVQSLGYEKKQVKARADDSVKVSLQARSSALAEVAIVKPEKIKEAHPQMGWDAYNKYLQRQALGDKAGTVRLSFTVNENGELSNFHIIGRLSDAADKKAIEIVRDGPHWLPDAGGKPKTVKLKIAFSIRNNE